MGQGFSLDDQDEQLFEFRRMTDDDEFEIPQKPQNRIPTDKPWIIAFVVVLLVLIPFLIYTLLYTELGRLSGSDDCGNFCGYKNKKYDEWGCTGKDYTEQKYEHVTETVTDEFFSAALTSQKECVSTCPINTMPVYHTCLPKNAHHTSIEVILAELGVIGQNIAQGWWAILLSSVVSCLLCLGALSLFKYAVEFVVWFILIGSIGVLGIGAGACWYFFFLFENDDTLYHSETNNRSKVFLKLAIVCTVAVVFLLIILTCCVKRVKLIIALFKETGKSIFDVPSLILVPIYASILMTITFLIFILLTFFMALSGKLTEIVPNYLDYRLDEVMIITHAYNTFVFIWVVKFILGCQTIIAAGAISSWFFTRNKHQLKAPLWTSFTNFVFFHLGTVAIGSLILALMSIVRAIIRGLSQNRRTRWLVDCCLERIEELLRFLSNNAYIQTAMHGQPFFKSGKRAAKLLVSNAANVIAVNSIGDFVLCIAQLLVMVIASGAGTLIAMATGLKYYWAIAVVCAIIAIIITAMFFSILQTTIDCIFMCFCEDTTVNDGMAKPYFMSKSLMQFIEDSKAIMPNKE